MMEFYLYVARGPREPMVREHPLDLTFPAYTNVGSVPRKRNGSNLWGVCQIGLLPASKTTTGCATGPSRSGIRMT